MGEIEPTDPTGRSFLSYRQPRGDDEGARAPELLIRAQHDLGIPTWQDVRDLDGGPMEEAVEEVLLDPQVANAVLWITPEIADSAFVRKVEVPRILEREARGDGFFVHPVAGGGLGYQEAAAALGGALGVHDLRTRKIQEVGAGPFGLPEARGVAEQVLRRRLQAIDRRLPEGDPLLVELLTRAEAGFRPGTALVLDWSDHFDHRRARAGAWEESLLPALQTVRRAVEQRAPGRPLALRGRASLSAGLAVGCAFPALLGIECVWYQYTPVVGEQPWHQGASREATGVTASLARGPVEAEDLAVLVSVTEDVAVAFGDSKGDLPPFRGVLTIAPARTREGKFQPLRIATPGQALDVLETIVEEVRQARRELRTRRIHLFSAIPLGLAFLLGQRLNTLGPVQTYEMDEPNNVGRYHPELLLRPDLFS